MLKTNENKYLAVDEVGIFEVSSDYILDFSQYSYDENPVWYTGARVCGVLNSGVSIVNISSEDLAKWCFSVEEEKVKVLNPESDFLTSGADMTIKSEHESIIAFRNDAESFVALVRYCDKYVSELGQKNRGLRV